MTDTTTLILLAESAPFIPSSRQPDGHLLRFVRPNMDPMHALMGAIISATVPDLRDWPLVWQEVIRTRMSSPVRRTPSARVPSHHQQMLGYILKAASNGHLSVVRMGVDNLEVTALVALPPGGQVIPFAQVMNPGYFSDLQPRI